MEENIAKKNTKGLVSCIISAVLTLASIICCAYFGFMIKEHFDLQASAEGWEGLGSIGIILVAIIFAGSSIIGTLASTLFSIISIVRAKNKIKLFGIILLVINVLVIIANIVLFVVLKVGSN